MHSLFRLGQNYSIKMISLSITIPQPVCIFSAPHLVAISRFTERAQIFTFPLFRRNFQLGRISFPESAAADFPSLAVSPETHPPISLLTGLSDLTKKILSESQSMVRYIYRISPAPKHGHDSLYKSPRNKKNLIFVQAGI